MTSEQLYLDLMIANYLTGGPLLAATQADNPNIGMHIDTDGRLLIEAFEGREKLIYNKPGFVTTYYDSVGVLTIGYGHTNLGNIPPHIKQGDVWTFANCDEALANDMSRFEIDVIRCFPHYKLNQDQFNALGSEDFNTGSLARSSIPAKIIAGRLDAAMATLLQYDHAGGQVLAGLTRRRHAEKLMFEGNVAAALVLAGAHRDTRMGMAKGTTAPGGEVAE